MSLTVNVNESESPGLLDAELWYWTPSPLVQLPMLVMKTLPPPGVVGETDQVRMRFDGFVT
jgi:hypothetical protein